ncbi:hypothetical protein ACFL2Q_15630 [Thermodesulfobacteriota bacterium]
MTASLTSPNKHQRGVVTLALGCSILLICSASAWSAPFSTVPGKGIGAGSDNRLRFPDSLKAPNTMITQKTKSSDAKSRKKPKTKSSDLTFKGSGKSLKDPVVVKGIPSTRSLIDLEFRLIEKKFGLKYKVISQGYVKKNGKSIDRYKIRTADGKEHEIFFDFTELASMLKKRGKAGKKAGGNR